MVSFNKLVTAGLLAVSAFAAPHKNVQKRGGGGSRRGAAYNDATLVSILADGGAVSWAYNWNMRPDGQLPPGVEYVPMLWGAKMLDGWASSIENALSSGSQHILGFNEPDLGSQASMSVQEAVDAYRQHITPYADRATLVTPAVTNGGGPNMGLDWMKSFLTSCSDCKASVMAIHWYGDSADTFKDHVTQAINLAQQNGLKEVWITEFATNNILEAPSFLTEVLPWLDAQPGVGRYSYFYCASGSLLEGNSLSASGKAYVSG